MPVPWEEKPVSLLGINSTVTAALAAQGIHVLGQVPAGFRWIDLPGVGAKTADKIEEQWRILLETR